MIAMVKPKMKINLVKNKVDNKSDGLTKKSSIFGTYYYHYYHNLQQLNSE